MNENVVESKLLAKHNLVFRKVSGQGAFGKVIQCFHTLEKKDYAIKMIHKNQIREDEYNKLLLEAEILRKLSHRNIIRFQNVIESSSYLYIVMELAQQNLK